ncbi:MAG: phosphomannomutase [Parcubacteria group bacterium Gr01-1014_19]|nr:MAG: phosphomannomutase [Parcubacteria group bacterium Gr01-1014_19]
MKEVIFKAYDVRGRYPDEINEEAVAETASVLAKRWKKGKVLIGHDARLSSPSLYKAISRSLVVGRKSLVVVSLGECTTPMFYFWCHRLKSPGIMITASHNPKDFNGLKVVGPTGEVISGSEIKKWIPLETAPALARPGGAVGRAVSNGMDYLKPYVGFLEKKVKLAGPLSVVFDCFNGVTGIVVSKLKANGLKARVLNHQPDGRFPAHGPNPMLSDALSQLKKEVKKQEADFGAAFDADGDRVFFVDDRGREVPSDAVLGLISQAFRGPIAVDVRAGYLAKELMGAGGKRIIESRVGHYFFKKLMKAKKAGFGGEMSGHYYSSLAPGKFFDSGIAAALYFANEVSELKRLGGKLSDWLDSLPKYYRSGESNFVIRDKNEVIKEVSRRYSRMARKISRKDGLKMEFADWWFIIRPSQTEDFLRLNLEAKDKKVFQKRLAELRRFF